MARLLREKKSRANAKLGLDQYTKEALKFQLGMAKCTDDIARWDLMVQYPDLYAAYLIFDRSNNEERHPMRYAVEARILAGQTSQEIAALLGVTPDAVEYYERVFFNVRDKLKNSDYVMTCVLGPSVHSGLSDRDYDLLWKLFGYIYGPAVLDSFISTTSRRFRPETLGEVDATLADDARSALQRKVAIVARTFTINPFSQSELLNIYTRFLEVEKESNNGKAQDVIMQNIQVMLDKLPWTGGDGAHDPLLKAHDISAIELRTDELLAISSGKGPAYEIEEPAFPEPEENG